MKRCIAPVSYTHLDVYKRQAQAQTDVFAPLPGGNPAFGFQTGAFWFYVPIENQQRDDPVWLLVQEYALSDNLDSVSYTHLDVYKRQV